MQNFENSSNLALLTDFYQLTMMQGYFFLKPHEVAVFDMYYRKNPCGGGYAIFCGMSEVVDYIENLHFSSDDIAYLRSLGSFKDEFLTYLENFKFSGEIYAVDEGEVVFPHEPLIRVKANIIEAQLIETAILNTINFQTLIATKSSRINFSAGEGSVMEFGLRRAQDKSAAIFGAKAAIIGGCVATSNVLAAKIFDIPAIGTHSHAWIGSFPSEIEAFRAYAKIYPDSALLLVDTYDTLNSGVPNAIKVFEELREQGHKPLGIRIDSGDLEYLTKQSRKMLDNAGFKDAKITASNDLDEYAIDQLKLFDAKIDSWGIGTRLITGGDSSSLGGVYKLSGIEKEGEILPKIKISNDPRKINNPGYKQFFRLYDKDSGMALADLITLENENIDESAPLEIFHPLYTYKRKKLENFSAKAMLKPVFVHGKFVGEKKSVMQIAEFSRKAKAKFWCEYLRNIHPQTYKVDLSAKLWETRKSLIDEINANLGKS
ncbi:nicotinate phosphoribosyltransferase [Campylobacter sp. JMF_08 NE1]|uniref:nicotinate phosphoribosyltransferase n=1 Tax=Campylobacter sp. JMF_08 NE1 TaxID=2983821 RepID=UPI0022E9C4BF|nr:nicotinate phosphoribosyltransferase [Campylobacter sp. JMF_08 NE1]MDA3047818.1 nicotinate phosphoribosyltransferase [Campylobacter sp. JMF_08 NE1]